MILPESIKKLNELDLAELDLENVGTWPLAVRLAACVITFILVLLLGYQFHLSNLQDQLDRAMTQENEWKQEFQLKAFQAANLQEYRTQMQEMETSFGALVRQLPSDTEVPGLLEDITLTGRNAGLQFETIKLQPEKATEFYIELPISISVKGNFHDLGSFVSGVAGLSRIVTLHDFSIDPAEGTNMLKMGYSGQNIPLQRQEVRVMRFYHWISIVLLHFLLAGCAEQSDIADLDQFMAQMRAKPSGKIEALPEFKSYEAFTYGASGMRSPFEPPISLKNKKREINGNVRPDFDRPKGFLEQFDIESFELVGSISNENGLWGLIRSEEGVHMVKEGDYLGRNHGRIDYIDEEEIRIIEIVPAGAEVWIERPRNMIMD